MGGERARYTGSPKALAAALQPVVLPLGRSWLKYGESQRRQGAAVNADLIKAAHPLLSVLHDQQPNLAFTKKLVTDVVLALYQDNYEAPGWKLREEDVPSYTQAMAARLVCLCRAVAGGERKHPNCGWVKLLPWRGATNEVATEVEPAPSKDTLSYLYGWDKTLSAAWRCPPGAPKHKEVSCAVVVPAGSKDDDPVCARWGDGHEWLVPDLTVAEFRDLEQSGAGRSSACLWQGVHVVSKHCFKIVQRPDRSPLLVLLEQRKQVLVEVATLYMQNKIERADLTTNRDRLMSAFPPVAKKARTAKTASAAVKKPTAEAKQDEGEESKASEQAVPLEPVDVEPLPWGIVDPPDSDDSFF